MSVWVIVPTAGSGTRFGGPVPKPLLDIDGKPVIVRTLEVFEACAAVEGIVVVAPLEWMAEYTRLVHAHGFRKVRTVVAGGATRSQSVHNGIQALGADADIVMVHDGVRPCVTAGILMAGLEAVKKSGAAIAAVPVKPTIKTVDPRAMAVTGTLDRDTLWEVQTPQVFKHDLLERAYAGDIEGATDDASLVERMGVPVHVFAGASSNVKITTPDDLVVAAALLKMQGR